MKNQLQEPGKSLQNPPLLQKGGDSIRNNLENELGINKKLEDDIYKNIIFQLEVKKVYLDSKLTLTKFSSIVGTNTTYLSNTVNRRFGVNLKGLVNRYRVEHAKGLIRERGAQTDMGEVIRLSGFSSRSIFYSAFRRETGISPMKYQARTAAEDYMKISE